VLLPGQRVTLATGRAAPTGAAHAQDSKGTDRRGRHRQKWSRGQVEVGLANMPPCLIGMEACVGAHHLARKIATLGHDTRLMPAEYVRAYAKGQKNDFNDAEAIAEAVQRPT
jgi:transposase